MKINKLLILVFILSNTLLNAQTNFKNGFIITQKGDTISGQIDYLSDIIMSSVCTFKDKNNIITKYSPNDITAYQFIDGKYYISKKTNIDQVFLEFLIKGEINIYYTTDTTGDRYYLDKEGVKLTEITNEEGIKHIDGKNMFYRNKNHVGILNYYMEDAPNFTSRIEELEEPNHKGLIKLAEDYHNQVCKDGTTCIIYEKKQKPYQFNVEVLGGIVDYRDKIIINKNYFHGGVLGHLQVSRRNENLYLRTGILYSNIETKTLANHSFYKIPFQIEYIYPTGIIKPKAATGINMYAHHTIAFMGGANINLSKSTSISINYDIDFDHADFFVFIPKIFFSHSITAGLLFKL